MKKVNFIFLLVFIISCAPIPADNSHKGGGHNNANQDGSAKTRKAKNTNEPVQQPNIPQNPQAGDQTNEPVVETAGFSNKSGVTFNDGFETSLLTNWGSLSPLQTPQNKNNWQIDHTVKRCGNGSLRIEVNPGDMSKNDKSERAELVGMKNSNGNFVEEDLNSGTQYYALSIMVPASWVALADKRGGELVHGTFFQLHGNADISGGIRPMFAMNITDRFYIMHHSGDVNDISYNHDSQKYTYEFSNGKINPGHWTDFVIKIKYAATSTGEITVWRRDEGETNFNQVLDIPNTGTLFYQGNPSNVLPHKWHCGYYRSMQGNVSTVLWLDCITRANSFESAVMNAFGK